MKHIVSDLILKVTDDYFKCISSVNEHVIAVFALTRQETIKYIHNRNLEALQTVVKSRYNVHSGPSLLKYCIKLMYKSRWIYSMKWSKNETNIKCSLFPIVQKWFGTKPVDMNY